MANQDIAQKSPEFLGFIRQQARELASGHKLPKNLTEWQNQRKHLRQSLIKAVGGFPAKKCELAPHTVGNLAFDGYTVEKVVLQTIPGVMMTTNVYRPQGKGPFPAVLCVHGHWPGAKQDPTVQARCIGLVKLGFLVLAVDALGAGERGVDQALGEYHGEMTAATLYATGRSLAGIQIYENMRCADYLQSRRDVDSNNLAITGTSGGGNQTMYAGALEERFKAVIPVCSVGNYQAYLGVACCMCELLPGALAFTEEWGVLGLVAPRGLMVINATQDAVQFSVAEAKKSLTGAQAVFKQFGKPENVKHVIVESKHDYNQPMREAMYGWVTLHLKGEGDGSPIAEPPVKTVDSEMLRCFQQGRRPVEFQTVPMLAKRFATQMVSKQVKPLHKEHWEAQRILKLGMLRRYVGKQSGRVELRDEIAVAETEHGESLEFEISPEQGVSCGFKWSKGSLRGEAAENIIISSALVGGGLSEKERNWCLENRIDVLEVTLRATGRYEPESNTIGHALDHNAAQWAAWIGRPLAGQWVKDFQAALAWVIAIYETPPEITMVSRGAAVVPALLTTAIQSRISRLVAIDPPLTLVSDRKYGEGQLGAILPGMLAELGDIGQLFSLVAPRPSWVIAGKNMQAETLERKELIHSLSFAASIYKVMDSRELHVLSETGREVWLERVFGS